MDELDTLLEQYLIGDLRELKTISVGYPKLMTLCAGAELLGALLNDGATGTRKEKDFVDYWTTYLYPHLAGSHEKAEAFYVLVRHGVMHHFFPKGPIAVGRGQPELHMTTDAAGVLFLNVDKLIDDFITAYEDRVVPILAKPDGNLSRASMRQRFIALIDGGMRAASRQSLPSRFQPTAGPVTTETTAMPGPVLGTTKNLSSP